MQDAINPGLSLRRAADGLEEARRQEPNAEASGALCDAASLLHNRARLIEGPGPARLPIPRHHRLGDTTFGEVREEDVQSSLV